jgi:hypothetical protein
MGCLADNGAPDRLYRVARKPDPWRWPDWAYAHADGMFGNRWDDPRGLYRVLYASTHPLGCYLEVLAWYRPDPKVVAEMAEILDNAPELPKTRPAGELPSDWLDTRMIGEIRPKGSTFADIGHSRSLAALNRDLAGEIVRHNLDELDGAAIRSKAPRALTGAISRHVYEHATAANQLFAGIFYESRHGNDLHNFALFEDGDRWDFDAVSDHPVSLSDRDLQHAMEMLQIRIA